MAIYLDFEQNVAELEGRIVELNRLVGGEYGEGESPEIQRLKQSANEAIFKLYANLTPWQIAQVARHPQRPHSLTYIAELFEDFTPLAGDRAYGEDRAIIAGLARFRGTAVAVLGQEKGSDTKSRLKHNFGMPMPEGYRKAVRLMDLANRFRLPVISFIDTAGAFPGIEAEARGQAQAIATSISACLKLTVPSVAVVIGEGMSGGAMAIAAMSRVLMLKYAVYNVISPEGAASILWRDSTKSKDAAEAMKFTADALFRFGIIDGIIPEPLGGAHRFPNEAITAVGSAIQGALEEMQQLSSQELLAVKRTRYLEMGRNIS
ncbi:acetyl-CoA carboxylase carboxyltransferase subunit alpha [Rhizobium rhizogenes]|uniref:acetyl-CoA carboxylase carboxyltransferase subunit alpha n=1 Tax=Rhizobium rhizogenes TaxID=359 RepID=UPI0015731128|nr:acetyl-CoA carboxylase carboxyltransferase subunit alpha [Rhizobium rhizogenes]NTG65154.1 acetyl-CoA carboxylase carboxyltransferase subunit alpha [Rhizobium rhizogenes]NTH68895.1 acetyl-CoA carboxylase carboxyltransferase subunit alpha [Rhizobium rhizogenes]NTI00356.1 acetyl-CoA carboxylase carboxyltransferase subunit alpha [Rhizobium rhizogenes]NTI38942.1 acetyl-CoA carboxylase carboxyltransferase subunit alpha [Rhizobium rhizogenes]NTJ18482.1 acetyl-CoA carboxylase carboxyltransferase su